MAIDPPHTPPASFWTVIAASASVMAIVLTVVGGVGSIIIGGLAARIDELKGKNADFELRMAPLLTLYAQHESDKEQSTAILKSIDGKVDQEAFKTFDRMITDRITAVEKSSADRSAETVGQVHALEVKIVPREENQFHWLAFDALALRVNDLSKGAVCPK